MKCSTSSNDSKCPSCLRMLLGAIAVFAFFMGFDFLVHHNILEDTYKATAKLWRPKAEMDAFFPYCMIVPALTALLFTKAYCFFMKHSCCETSNGGKAPCPYGQSLVFGLWFGLVIGAHDAMSYFYLPVAKSLTFSWVAADIIKFIFAAILLKLVFCKKSANCAK